MWVETINLLRRKESIGFSKISADYAARFCANIYMFQMRTEVYGTHSKLYKCKSMLFRNASLKFPTIAFRRCSIRKKAIFNSTRLCILSDIFSCSFHFLRIDLENQYIKQIVNLTCETPLNRKASTENFTTLPPPDRN